MHEILQRHVLKWNQKIRKVKENMLSIFMWKQLNFFWSSLYIFQRLQIETRTFSHILGSNNNHDGDYFCGKWCPKWLILHGVFWCWAQSLTFRTPQLYQEMKITLTEKRKTRNNPTGCFPSAGTQLFSFNIFFWTKGLCQVPDPLKLTHCQCLSLEEEKGIPRKVLILSSWRWEKNILKLLLLSKFRSWFVKPGLAKVLNQSKMDLHL